MSKKKKDWKTEKERLLNMDVEDRRKEYRRSEYVSLEKILTWRQTCKDEVEGKDLLSDKVSLYKGDITILELDAIVNAANSSLLGGGGVDGCIHKAAGSCLFDECQTLRGCETGKAKITCGYDLPAKYVIHTVGPVAREHVGRTETSNLTACYQNSLKLVKENGLRTVAFPCISTGIYGFPNEPAAEIALNTVKAWIKENYDQITRVIFCVFLETDYKIYKEKISHIFQDNDETNVVIKGPQSEGNTSPSKTSKDKTQSGDSNDDEGNTAEEDAEESTGPEEQAEDVEMESQREDTDMEANKNDETEDVNVPTKAEEVPPADSKGTEEETGNADDAPAELEQSQTMDMTSEPERSTPNDETPEEKSSTSSDVDLKALADDSQGSDLTQTDTQSKGEEEEMGEPEDMK